eukprot:4611291-Amphidinium_carterae.1
MGQLTGAHEGVLFEVDVLVDCLCEFHRLSVSHGDNLQDGKENLSIFRLSAQIPAKLLLVDLLPMQAPTQGGVVVKLIGTPAWGRLMRRQSSSNSSKPTWSFSRSAKSSSLKLYSHQLAGLLSTIRRRFSPEDFGTPKRPDLFSTPLTSGTSVAGTHLVRPQSQRSAARLLQPSTLKYICGLGPTRSFSLF